MKTISKFEVVKGQEWISPIDQSHFERFWSLDGRQVSDWNPPVMTIFDEESAYSDFPWLGEHAPILRKPAVDALTQVLLQYGQLLPLRGEEVWLFNATTMIDALDTERSQIAYFDDGSILAIERHAFKTDVIGEAEIFKLPMRASPVYVTDVFVDRVRKANLRGVTFIEVWRGSESLA